jgi:hypothetical protein
MERDGKNNKKNRKSKRNRLAVHNLKELNRAVKHGLWGGRVKVFEFGSNALKGSEYESRPSTAGEF